MTVDKSVDTKKLPKKKRELFIVDLGELKEPWVSYCRRSNTTPSKAFKEIVKKLTGVGQGNMLFKVVPERLPDAKLKKRMELRWTESEYEAILKLCDGHSSPGAWVIDSVRARLTNSPQFGMNEISALWESSAQLMKIGTNLNQIARAINMNTHETELARLELLEEIRLEIRSHTAKVANLLNANLKRWDIQ
jgi:hypothetical protein